MSEQSEKVRNAPASKEIDETVKPHPAPAKTRGIYHSKDGQIICEAVVIWPYATGQVRLDCMVSGHPSGYVADRIPVRLTMDATDSRRWFCPNATMEEANALFLPEEKVVEEEAEEDVIPDVPPVVPSAKK